MTDTDARRELLAAPRPTAPNTDLGMAFQAVVSAITGEQWRSGAAARRRGLR